VDNALDWLILHDKEFEFLNVKDYPEGWEFLGSEANPAFAWKIFFDVSVFPTQEDMDAVARKLHEIADKVIMPCRNCGEATGLKVWQCDLDETYLCGESCRVEWYGEDSE
jgi:hypothetical protein